MLTYKNIRLTDIVYFKQAELDLDWKGTTFITGSNLNAKSANRRNGVGKSLLLSPIPHLAFGDPAGLSKTLARHSLLTDDGSELAWQLEVDGSDWLITKRRKKNRVSWSIERDGVDLKPRTATVAESMVEELMPFSEEDFYSFVYLDSRRPSQLLMGSMANRQAYLASLLRINEFDRVREYVKGRMSDINQLASKRDGLASTLPAKETDLAKLEANLQKGEKLLEQTRRRLDEVRDNLRKRKLYQQHRQDLRLSRGFDMDEYRRMRELDRIYLIRTRQEVEYEAYLSEVKEYKAKFRKLLTDVGWPKRKPMNAKKIHVWVKREFTAAKKQVTSARKAEERRLELISTVRRLKRDRHAAVHKKKATFKNSYVSAMVMHKERLQLTNQLAQAKADIKQIRETIEHLEKHRESGGSTCPLCGSELSQEETDRQLASAKTKLAFVPDPNVLAKKQKALASIMSLWTRDKQKELGSASKGLKGLTAVDKSEVEKLVDRIKRLNEVIIHMRWVPDPVDEPYSTPNTDLSHREIEEWMDGAEEKARAWANVKAVRKDALAGRKTPPLAKLESGEKSLVERAEQLEAKVSAARTRYNNAVYQADKTKKTERRIAKLDRRLKDRQVLSRLLDAYGSKGLRLAVLKDATNRICDNLNRFAPLLFPERMTFSADVTSSGISLLVERSDGKTSDIRHMSGAESRLFSLVWLLSVLPMVPESRRSNLVVLDEFEANLDKPTRDLLIGEYLPALNEVVDHIVFITPEEPPEPNHGRRSFTVVKEGDHSVVIAEK